MNNTLDLSSLREELEKQKKERERLITENALAEVKHQAALEEGEGSNPLPQKRLRPFLLTLFLMMC
jgi:hypothetical protein